MSAFTNSLNIITYFRLFNYIRGKLDKGQRVFTGSWRKTVICWRQLCQADRTGRLSLKTSKGVFIFNCKMSKSKSVTHISEVNIEDLHMIASLCPLNPCTIPTRDDVDKDNQTIIGNIGEKEILPKAIAKFSGTQVSLARIIGTRQGWIRV